MASVDISSLDKEILAEIQGLLPDSFKFSQTHERFSYSANQVLSAVVESAEVVIKPFRGEFHKARADHEAQILDIVRNCGIPTLRPTMLCLGGVANYLLTRYEPDIIPLDQIDLKRMPEVQFKKIVSNIGRVLGSLHGSGIVHGDFQHKNLFTTPNREIGVMDFETAELYDDPDDPGYESGCHYDLRKLTGSLSRELGPDSPIDFEIPLMASYQNPPDN